MRRLPAGWSPIPGKEGVASGLVTPHNFSYHLKLEELKLTFRMSQTLKNLKKNNLNI